MKEQGNLLLAIVLSLLILLGFQYFFKAPKMEKEVERKKHIEQTESLINKNSDNLEDDITGYLDLENALNKDERIKIVNQAYKYFLEKHTWDHKVKHLLQHFFIFLLIIILFLFIAIIVSIATGNELNIIFIIF